MPAPIPIEMSELMMRLRSSLRCSKKVMAPAGSSSGVVCCELGLLGRSGGLCSLLALRLKGLALHFAHLFFEGALKVRGGLSELRHELTQAAGELGELLRP